MPYDIIVGRTDSDKELFGNNALVYLGKSYVKMGRSSSLSNRILMDVARSHVVLVAGKRGSGKSYSLGVIAEEISSLPEDVSQNIGILIFDTMGIYWTMAHENEKEEELLRSWNLEAKKIPVNVFVPYGFSKKWENRGIANKSFALKVSELSADDWIVTFGIDFLNDVAIVIQRNIADLKEREKDFDIDDIINEIDSDSRTAREIRNAAVNLFEGAKTWGLFAEKAQEGTKVRELIEGGKTSVLDLSCYSSTGTFNVRALVIGLISKKLFNERMAARKEEEIESVKHGLDYLEYQEKREMPLVWLVIDECLTGDTEIITDKAHTPMQDIINKFENGEKIKVLAFDKEKNEFNYYDIDNVYRKGKRKIINLITETGESIKCTPEHRVLTKQGFASAFSVDEIASPVIQHYSQDTECIKARVLGHLFGDGWASAKTKGLGFSGKINPDDLNKIKQDLKSLGFKSSNIFSRKTFSKITNSKGKEAVVNGISHSIQASTKAFNFFAKLGAPIGEKVLNKTEIPEWLFNAPKEEKAEFLAALMGSDGQIISKAKNAKGDFNAIRFSFNKIEELEKKALEYAFQIKSLFEDVGIRISNISKKEANIRKDNKKTIKITLTLEKNIENIIKFLDKIGYRYCSKKELEGIKWSAYLRARLFLKKEREKIYNKAIEMHKSGLGKTKIARQLNFPEAQIRDWIYGRINPGLPKEFPDIDEWISKRLKDNLLFEKIFTMQEIEEEEVFDISIDKVHNFVSNGFITHNCHEFLPKESKTAATDALIQLLREGRQPGISLALATQQPGMIHHDVLTQSDIVLSHRVTAKPDIDALSFIMQSYLPKNILGYLNDLPKAKGTAIILDDNSERIYPMRIHARYTWHGGEAPTSVKIKKRI